MRPEIKIEDSQPISSVAAAAARVKKARKIVGHKIGPTSKAMQASSRIDEPETKSRSPDPNRTYVPLVQAVLAEIIQEYSHVRRGRTSSPPDQSDIPAGTHAAKPALDQALHSEHRQRQLR